MAALFRRPLVRFLLAGAVLAVLHANLWNEAPPPPAPVVVDADTLAALRGDWVRTTGRQPSGEEVDALVQDWVDRELLARAALELGIQHHDALIRRRLIQNQRFLDASALTGADAEPDEQDDLDDGELLARAYALELERSDPVVRRRLIERMREIILSRAAATGTTTPPRALPAPDAAWLRLSHVFLSRDRNGPALRERAASLLARLRETRATPDDTGFETWGDPLPIPGRLPPSSPERLAGRLGPEFAEGLHAAPVGAWSEPIESSYGLHLVWVHERSPEPDANAQTAGSQPATAARDEASLQRALQILRQDVDVIRYDRPHRPPP